MTSAAAPEPSSTRAGGALFAVLARAAYWSPVLAALVLFSQVSFLGLRPALCESKRLADAEVVLGERHAHALSVNRDVSLHLQARQDPIYLERQRRMRTFVGGSRSTAD